jgi:CheY-like chemotaxis protein
MNRRVLIVEDDETIREMYAIKFDLEGFEVDTAENGLVALEKMSSFRPEIIVLDLMMPVMSGIEFLQRLDPDLRGATQVVVFTNTDAPQHLQAAQKLGITTYLLKSDYTPDRLLRELSSPRFDR